MTYLKYPWVNTQISHCVKQKKLEHRVSASNLNLRLKNFEAVFRRQEKSFILK